MAFAAPLLDMGTMARNKALIGTALVALAVAIYFVFFAGTDEEKIRKVVDRLAHALEVRPPNARAIDELVDDDVHLSAAELGSREGKRGLGELGAQVSLLYTKVSVDAHDLTIKLDPSKTTAKVGGRATVRGTTALGEDRRDERAFDLLMRKEGTAWKVTSVTVWPER
jgi:hypothetical protein